MATTVGLTGLSSDVEALAAIERRAATGGDRRSAEWAAARLREAGAEDVSLEPFRCQSTWATPYAAHQLAGIAAAARGGLAGSLLALATAASYERDYTGRSQWLRALLPAGEGTNVVARIPASDERRRTVVLVAHHDAAHTGLVWDPRFLEAGRERARKTGMTPSFITLPLAALGLIATGLRPLRALGAGVLGLGIGLGIQAAASETVPGASDNATGVAGVLEIVRSLVADPVEGLEVIALAPSGEEVGMSGMYAWMRGEGQALDPDTTLVLGLDTLGAGDPVVASRESWTAHYRDSDLDLADHGASRAGLPPPQRIGLGAGTDPAIAMHAGIPTISILSWSDGGFGNYHLPTDTPENVNWDSVERCVRLAEATVRAWASGM